VGKLEPRQRGDAAAGAGTRRELSLTGDEPAGGGLRRQRRFEPGERHERRREKAREEARHAGADDVADVGNDRREVGWWR
jgi:hypothetical protein